VGYLKVTEVCLSRCPLKMHFKHQNSLLELPTVRRPHTCSPRPPINPFSQKRLKIIVSGQQA